MKVAVMASALFAGVAVAQTTPSVVCPLSERQTNNSIEAFARIVPTLTREPRCANCHGGVNPFIAGVGSDSTDADAPASVLAHGGGRILRQFPRGPDGTPEIEGECRDCHNNMPRRRDGGESLWMTAPNFLSFIGKDATTLCKQIKRSTGEASHFLGHLEDDNGGNAFGKTAFIGNRGLDPGRFDIPPAPPSISHAALMQLGRHWVDAMGGSFKGGESCGCEEERYTLKLKIITTMVSDPGFHNEMGPVEIPIEFRDDGTFVGTDELRSRGAYTLPECTVVSHGGLRLAVAGKAVEKFNAVEQRNDPYLRIEMSAASAMTVSASAPCPDGGSAQFGGQSAERYVIDVEGSVGTSQRVPMASMHTGVVNTAIVEILRRE